jgi:acetyl-CoA C-acetyltransferase
MVPDQIGGAGRPVCTIPGDGITGLGNAVMHVASGIADVVVLEAHSKVADVIDKEAVESLAQEPTYLRPLGMESDTIAALEMGLFFAKSGFGIEDCDLVIDRSKRAGARNPRASYGFEKRRVDSGRSELVSSPMRKVDRAPYADAAVVLVLASSEWARKNKTEGICIEGVAWSSSLPWFDGGESEAVGYARESFQRAAAQAELKGGLDSLDLMEVDDTYSFKLLQHVLSLSKDREQAKAILRGKGPAVNPSGGSLAVGNLIEATASHRILEAVLQLRGGAKGTQVKGAKRALVQSWRGVPTATGGVAILSVSS